MKFKNLVLNLSAILILSSTAFAQLGSVESSLFDEADNIRQELDIIQAPILSPGYYQKAVEAYNEARNRYERKKSLSSIEKLISDFKSEALKAKETAHSAKTFFVSSLAARKEALQFKADEYAEEKFREAEEKFTEATSKYEENNLNKAQKIAGEAEVKYNEASLKAIKTSLLDEARIYIQEAKNLDAEKFTPKTYLTARQLLQQVEEKLNANYTPDSNVKEMAEKATYESKHAIELTKIIRKLKKDDTLWERLMLIYEDIFQSISSEFNYTPQFNNDYDKDLIKVRDDIVMAIKNVKEENMQLKKELKSLQEKNESLIEELDALQSSQQKVAKELEAKKELEKKISDLEKMFNIQEARVLRSGDRVIIRLYGLSFPSGKSDILPDYFQLLTRVQKAIRALPVAQVIIEGHTDAIGNESYNLNLSQDRARAISSYLIANMGVDASFIQSEGYGKAKPIAPNDTAENRAKNRRIDVVLILKGQQAE